MLVTEDNIEMLDWGGGGGGVQISRWVHGGNISSFAGKYAYNQGAL